MSAIDHKIETTLIKLMAGMKSRDGSKPKRKRRRGAGQSTHLGKYGVAVAILIQRQIHKEQLKKLAKDERLLNDEISKMKGIVTLVEEVMQQMPNSYWKWDALKGKKRLTMTKLFGIYKSSAKVDNKATSLKALNMTKESFKLQMEAFQHQINTKESTIPGVVARRREEEDFLASTAEYAVEDNNDNDANSNIED